MAKKKQAADPAKVQELDIPVELTDSDKANLLDQILINQEVIDKQEESLDELKAEQKEALKSANSELTIIKGKTEEMIKTAMAGKIIKQLPCVPTKNFEKVPAVLEYRDAEDTNVVLHSRVLKEEEFAISMDDEVIGVPPKGSQNDDGDMPV